MIDTAALKNRILALAVTGQVANNKKDVKQLFESLCVNALRIDKNKISDKNYDLSDLPFEIPDNWKWVWLGDVFQHNTGKALNSSNTEGTSLEYITTSNLYWDRFELDELKSMLFKDSEIDKCTVKKGDLLICEGGDIGRSAIWSEDYEMRIQNHIHRLRPYLDEICVRFYFYVMMYYKNNGLINGRGIGLQGLSSKRLHSILVPLPDIETQFLIAEKIDESFLVIDTIDELQQQYSSDLEILKSKIIDAGIQGKLTEQLPEDGTAEELLVQITEEKKHLIKEKKIKATKALPEIVEDEIPFEIPKNWKWVRWGDLSQAIQYGYNAPAKQEGRIKMVRISDIQDGKVMWDMVPYCDIDETDIEAYLLHENDILFARTGGTVGKSYIVTDVPEESVFAGYLIRTSYSSKLCARYMKFFMESKLYWKQLQNGTIATAQPNCNGQTLSKMILPLPPYTEQIRIVETIEKAILLIQ